MAGLIVHEWIAQAGGSENVVDEFVKTFPDSHIQALWNDSPGRYQVPVRETWLARTPIRHYKAASVPFLPATWRSLTTSHEYEWMLVSSHLFAHHARLRQFPQTPKLVYVHTPARYIWEPDLDERGKGWATKLAAGLLKPLDRQRAQEAKSIATNSQFTRDRVRRSWGRDAEVIYPPVDVERISAVVDWSLELDEADARVLQSLPETFLLGASRFVSYKNLDAVIDAGVANGLPVVLAGSGPEEQSLRAYAATARTQVEFVPRPSDQLLYALYQRSIAFVFPAIEDFGIMPVEAMATGTPVLVPVNGGAAESVSLARGGALVRERTKTGWVSALSEALCIDRKTLPSRVQQFSSSRFRREIAEWVERSTS